MVVRALPYRFSFDSRCSLTRMVWIVSTTATKLTSSTLRSELSRLANLATFLQPALQGRPLGSASVVISALSEKTADSTSTNHSHVLDGNSFTPDTRRHPHGVRRLFA